MIFTADMLWVFPQKCPGREIWQSDPLQGVLILFPFRWKQPVTSNQTHLCIFKSEEHQNQDTEKKTRDWHLPRHLSTFGTKSILLTLKVQKCVSWRYQHTLRKTVKSMFTTGSNKFREKKWVFFLFIKTTFGFSDFEEPCWQMFAVCCFSPFWQCSLLLYGTNKIRIFTTECFWFCA